MIESDRTALLIDLEGALTDPAGRILFRLALEALIAAVRRGIPTVGALWGYGGTDELRAAGAAALYEAPLWIAAALRALPRVAKVLPP
jgi:phosphoglycolate phosphatase